MSSFSQFTEIQLFNNVDKDNLSKIHGYTQYGVSQFVNDTTTSGTSSVEELPYDAFTIAAPPDVYPLSVEGSTGDNLSDRFARHVWTNWETVYNRCKVKLLCLNGDEFSAGPFSSKNELYDWLNSVISHNGNEVATTAILRVYDEVAGDIPRIQKMYGVNTLYANLVGARNTKASSVKTAMSGNQMWLDIFEALTSYYAGTGDLPTTVSKSDLESDNVSYSGEGIGSNKLFWVGANKRNLYGIPKTGSYISLSDTVPGDYRKFWDISNASSVNQTVSDQGIYQLLSPCYVTYDESSKAWEILSPYPIGRFSFMADAFSDIAVVIVFLLKHFNDSNKFAFYVKPVGVNRLYVDYFNISKYQLEAVGFNRDRQFRVKPVTVTNSMQDLYGDRTGLTKPQWMIYDSDTKATNAGSVVPKSVKFRLRRVSDGKIGNLSIGTMKMIPRTSGAFMKWLVV